MEENAKTVATATTVSQEVTLAELKDHIHKRFFEIQADANTDEITTLDTAYAEYKNARKRRALSDLAQSVGLTVPTPDVDHAALMLLEAVELLPELRARSTTPAPVPQLKVATKELPPWPEDGGTTGPIQRYHTLGLCLAGSYLGLQRETSLMLIGGTMVPQKLDWLRAALGSKQVEWINIEDDTHARACDRTANQLKAGKLAGIIFFEHFMSHAQTNVLILAGRSTDLPVIAAGKAGQGDILRALAHIEEHLSAKAAGVVRKGNKGAP